MSRTPAYRVRENHGKKIAVVTLTDSQTGHRRDYYLGDAQSPESHERYHRLLAEWQAIDRRLPGAPPPKRPSVGPIVSQLCLAYSQNRPENDPNAYMISATIKLLGEMYGDMAASDFGPNSLRLVREAMIAGDKKAGRRGWSKSVVVERTALIVRIFRWAVAHELIDESVWRRLTSLERLDHRRADIRQNRKILPVPLDHVLAVQAIVGRQVAALIELQLLTGARVQELLFLRPCDIDRSEPVWKTKLEAHKTAHHGKRRTLYFGPRAQAVLNPYLLRPREKHLFSPAEAEEDRLRDRNAARITPESYGNIRGSNRKQNPKKKPRDHYDAGSYRRCIERACIKAGVPVWAPRQLRHNAATEIEKKYDSVVAAIMLGHSSAKITEAVYIERDKEKAVEVSSAIG